MGPGGAGGAGDLETWEAGGLRGVGVDPAALNAVVDDAYKLDVKSVQEAIPTTVNAGSSLSHQTRFVPLEQGNTAEERYKNYLQWPEFVELVNAVEEFELEITYQIMEEKPVIKRMKVKVDAALRSYLPKNKWYLMPCVHDS